LFLVEPWNVQTTNAVHDLDNLRVDEKNPSTQFVFAEFTLKHLVAYGVCRDKMSQSPPNGLQLVLGDIRLKNVEKDGASFLIPYPEQRSDTLVMKNLGYFQLQADPGTWSINLASGRASDIFEIVGADGATNDANVLGQEVVICNFLGKMQHLQVQKNEGMEDVPLLDDGLYDSYAGIFFRRLCSFQIIHLNLLCHLVGMATIKESLWDSFSSSMWAEKTSALEIDTKKPETIHVFSLATGHLYERFLRIMMVSVSKHASLPVKFWLLENFLSPSFKKSIVPMMERSAIQPSRITCNIQNTEFTIAITLTFRPS
jgi:UDP-glucose:glycoprotein glucosyltransferase